MEKIELAKIIMEILDEIIENTKSKEYKELISLRKWVLINLIYNYESASIILTKYWKYNIFHDNYDRCLSAEKLLDAKLNILIVAKLEKYMNNNRHLSDIVLFIKQVLDNFEENVYVLRGERFFVNHECIKKSLKLVDNI